MWFHCLNKFHENVCSRSHACSGSPTVASPATLTLNFYLDGVQPPVNADEFFRFADQVCIVPGVNAQFESFVVKCSVECLEKGNVVAVFQDPTGGGGVFWDFVLHGFAQLLEDAPQIFEFHILTDPSITVA